jgi:hypothetical protein
MERTMSNARRESARTANPTEFPPGIDVPAPPGARDHIAPAQAISADIERDIRQLADRVGGLARLRELVTELADR